MALSLQGRDDHVSVPDRHLQALSVLLGLDPYQTVRRVDLRELPLMLAAIRGELQRVHSAHVDAVGGLEPWRARWVASRLHDDDWYGLLLQVEGLLASGDEVLVFGD